MKRIIPIIGLYFIVIISCKPSEKVPVPDFKIEFDKVSPTSVFVNDTMSIWGGSVVKGEDGLYHMFYAQWPKHLGWAWLPVA